VIGTIIGALGATGRRITNRWDDGSAHQRAEPLHRVSDSLRGHAIRVGGSVCGCTKQVLA
jgi:hypothetical protein